MSRGKGKHISEGIQSGRTIKTPKFVAPKNPPKEKPKTKK